SNNDNSFISIPRRVGAGTIMLTGTFIIKGYNGKRTINAMRSETSSEYGRVIYNDGVDLQLENLTITGGYTCITTYPEEVPTGSDGAGIATVGNLTMTDCSVLNNTALNPTEGGGGIWCYNAILTLTRCTLRGNTAALPETYIDRSEWAGGAIYANNSSSAYYTTLTDCIISQNTGDSALAMSTLYMTGGKVTENIGNDCYGAGIYMSSGVLDGVEISGNHFTNDIDNTLAGGVYVHNSGSGITIKNCTIKQNSAVHGAGIYFNQDSGDDFVIENCTITQNTSVKSKTDPDDEYEFAAGIYYESVAGTIILKGVNTIIGNTLADGTASDIGMPSSAKFKIDGAMGKSRIGVYKLFYGDDTPSPGHPLDFTIDYGVANSAVPPANIFISQNGCGIAYNETTGEAGFAVSSGSLYTALDFVISVRSSSSFIKAGVEKTLSIATFASRKEHTDPVSTTELWYNSADKKFYLADDHTVKAAGDAAVAWTAALYIGNRKISDLTVTSTADGLKVTVPAQDLEDIYTLKLTATYLGLPHSANFNLTCLSADANEPVLLPAGTNGTAGTSATYVSFGEWPQTIKALDVSVDETVTRTQGSFTYCLGSDGCWYYKHTANPRDDDRFFSDGTAIVSGQDYYFKVEPILWRVLTTNYNDTGKQFFFTEKILDANTRPSDIQTHLTNVFLMTAFDDAERQRIVDSELSDSLTPVAKVFLLSWGELTNNNYGFMSNITEDQTRLRLVTDYARARYVDHETSGVGPYWTRTNKGGDKWNVCTVVGKTNANWIGTNNPYNVGIAPGLCVDW
ncbi:MAG: right-handed parallel beta-helix repeat-containing protein, partial [Treponema sp.]|nr:right-handed parallel beta-helix repeat-containing protein [Treponema sp.]